MVWAIGATFGVGAPVATCAASVFNSPPAASLGERVGEVQADTPLRLILALPLRDPIGAEIFVRRVSDPHSLFYGKYLTPTEYGKRFGASLSDYNALSAWATSNGLAVGQRTDARTTLSLSGAAATVEMLFNTKLATYRTPSGQMGFAPLTAPILPASLAGRVVGVIGLASATRTAPLLHLANPNVPRPLGAGGTGVGGGYSPVDLRAAYDIPVQLNPAVTETVAVFEQGGFYKSDIARFERHYHISPVPVLVPNVNGYKGAVNNPSVEAESVLDIDMLIGTNPAIKRIIDYEEGDDPFTVALLDSLAAMAQDDTAQTISISYGDNEVNQGNAALSAENVVLMQLAAQGQTVFVSSGDGGAYGRYSQSLNVEDPGSQPYVTSVGGTALFTLPKGGYYAETAWNLLGQGAGATGGGVSGYWPIPSYQLNPSGAFVGLPNGGSPTMRNVPDVAAVGSPATGVAVYSEINGGWLQIGGTSLSTPVWAGMSTVLNNARKAAGLPNIGFYNPLAYYLGLNSYGYNDVIEGDNGDISDYGIAGFNAGRGFDNVSGWGSLDNNIYAFNLLVTQFGTGQPPGVPHGVTATPTSGSVKLTWTPSTNTNGYLIQVVPQANYFVHFNAVTTGNSVVVPGLAADTLYSASVLSLNLNGAAGGNSVLFTTKSQ